MSSLAVAGNRPWTSAGVVVLPRNGWLDAWPRRTYLACMIRAKSEMSSSLGCRGVPTSGALQVSARISFALWQHRLPADWRHGLCMRAVAQYHNLYEAPQDCDIFMPRWL